MSASSSPDRLIRPEDKALEMLFTSIEEPMPNNFDELLNGDLYDLNDNDHNDDFADMEDFFHRPELTQESELNSPMEIQRARDKSPAQPWRKGLWCLNQGRGPTEIVIEKRHNNEYRNYETLHMSSLLHHDKTAPLSVGSPPTTPNYGSTKEAVSNPKTGRSRQSPYIRPAFSKEATLSPSPMYPRIPHGGSICQLETWQQDFQEFHLQMPHVKLPHSPPFSGSGPRPQALTREMDANVVACNATAIRVTGNQTQNHHNTIDQGILDPSHTSYGPHMPTSPYKESADSSHRYGHFSHQPIPVWVSENLESPGSSQHSSEYRGTIHDEQAHTCLPPPLVSQWLLPPQDHYPAIAAPMPRRLPHQILNQPSDILSNGLGIQYLDVFDSTLHDLQASSAVFSPPVHPPTSYPRLHSPNTHFTESDVFFTPRHRRQISSSLSPSPSISPTNIPRTVRQRSPTRTDRNHNRRKSLHKAGPIKEKDGNGSRTPRTPKTPKTPNSGFDFVNFTPRDSAKLLSDVAPSGSSKTRARREAEARDKRKRLSEAAVRAVRKAGGDVAALERAILT